MRQLGRILETVPSYRDFMLHLQTLEVFAIFGW
jgi:hypothetical protein